MGSTYIGICDAAHPLAAIGRPLCFCSLAAMRAPILLGFRAKKIWLREQHLLHFVYFAYFGHFVDKAMFSNFT